MITDEQIIEACKTEMSMSRSCAKLKMNYHTFRKRAMNLGVFFVNKSGKGIKKSKENGNVKFDLQDILNGKHPHYSSHKIRIRLIEERIKEDKCESCGISNIWNNKPLSMQLDHKDGDHCNHNLDNLQILCPNCHTQTKNHGSKKIKNNRTNL